jgi:hypothetical protein
MILAITFGCAAVPAAAFSQTKTQKKSPASSVSGRVTIHGKAAAGITVGIRSSDFSPQPAPALKATTDQEGNYRINDIPAGNYQVSPMAPAYVVSDLVLPRVGAKTLLLAEGEDVQGIDFSIVRGGVIAGKVIDADGRPVMEERVTLVSEDQANQRIPNGRPRDLSNLRHTSRSIQNFGGSRRRGVLFKCPIWESRLQANFLS